MMKGEGGRRFMMQHRALFTHSYNCVPRREAAFVTSWSGRCSQGRQVSGRKGAPQLPSADADEARLYIGLLLRGKLYHHLLLVNTDHLTSRVKQGATLEDETRPLSRQDVD